MSKKPGSLKRKEEEKVTETNWINSNAIHNYLNVIISVASTWALFDFTLVGLPKNTALFIVAGCGFIKLTMNAVRDGLKGMIEPQPPVAK